MKFRSRSINMKKAKILVESLTEIDLRQFKFHIDSCFQLIKFLLSTNSSLIIKYYFLLKWFINWTLSYLNVNK